MNTKRRTLLLGIGIVIVGNEANAEGPPGWPPPPNPAHYGNVPLRPGDPGYDAWKANWDAYWQNYELYGPGDPSGSGPCGSDDDDGYPEEGDPDFDPDAAY